MQKTIQKIFNDSLANTILGEEEYNQISKNFFTGNKIFQSIFFRYRGRGAEMDCGQLVITIPTW